MNQSYHMTQDSRTCVIGLFYTPDWYECQESTHVHVTQWQMRSRLMCHWVVRLPKNKNVPPTATNCNIAITTCTENKTQNERKYAPPIATHCNISTTETNCNQASRLTTKTENKKTKNSGKKRTTHCNSLQLSIAMNEEETESKCSLGWCQVRGRSSTPRVPSSVSPLETDGDRYLLGHDDDCFDYC